MVIRGGTVAGGGNTGSVVGVGAGRTDGGIAVEPGGAALSPFPPQPAEISATSAAMTGSGRSTRIR